MKHVAIIGTQGVPAQYGGFETLTEHLIGDLHSPDIQYTVFCSGKSYEKKLKQYKNAKLKYIPLEANGMQSIPYDIISMIKAIKGYDVILLLGVSGCIFLPFFRLLFRKRLVINIDGLEHRRAKWGKFTRWFLKQSEAMAVKYADIIISDNKGIYDYVKETYAKESVLIPYGGDHALREVTQDKENEILQKYQLTAREYDLSICRIEPENNCHLIIGAYLNSLRKLVFIGNWKNNEYGKNLNESIEEHKNISTVSGVYDLDELYVLRKNCRTYLHGHSAGGTNPSLVEAMFSGRPILAFDVTYNRETTENRSIYFKDITDLRHKLEMRYLAETGQQMLEVATRRYKWSSIIEKYERCYELSDPYTSTTPEINLEMKNIYN